MNCIFASNELDHEVDASDPPVRAGGTKKKTARQTSKARVLRAVKVNQSSSNQKPVFSTNDLPKHQLVPRYLADSFWPQFCQDIKIWDISISLTIKQLTQYK